MALTLLQIMQTVTAELALPSPTTVVASTDDQVKQLLALSNREGREQISLAGGWPQFRGEQLLTLINGQAAYNFPSDFDSYMPATIWDRDQRWPINGPLTAQEWQYVKSGIINTQPWFRYRVMDGQIFFDPTPTSTTAGHTIVIEYQSNAWCQSAGGVAQSAWLADTDTFKLNDDIMVLGIKWRFLAAKRMSYAQERQDWQDCVDREQARAYVGKSLPLNARALGDYNFLGDGYSQITDGNWPGRV